MKLEALKEIATQFALALKSPDIEVRVIFDNYDEFLSVLDSVTSAAKRLGVLDKEKSLACTGKGECVVLELTNNSAIKFFMTDRCMAQMDIQNKVDHHPIFALAWTVFSPEAREEVLQIRTTKYRTLRNNNPKGN